MSFKQSLCKFLFCKMLGWRVNLTVPIQRKCVICVAPHTSNFDLFVGKLAIGSVGWNSGFLMKSDWFFFPLGYIFRKMGGIPVCRSRRTSLTDRVAQIAREADEFVIAITPEGTRKRNPDWKKGFWHIAKGASIPILLAGIDYRRKSVEVTRMIEPGDSLEDDMAEIKGYFKDFTGKHPENFDTGL